MLEREREVSPEVLSSSRGGGGGGEVLAPDAVMVVRGSA